MKLIHIVKDRSWCFWDVGDYEISFEDFQIILFSKNNYYTIYIYNFFLSVVFSFLIWYDSLISKITIPCKKLVNAILKIKILSWRKIANLFEKGFLRNCPSLEKCVCVLFFYSYWEARITRQNHIIKGSDITSHFVIVNFSWP